MSRRRVACGVLAVVMLVLIAQRANEFYGSWLVAGYLFALRGTIPPGSMSRRQFRRAERADAAARAE